MRAIIFDLDGTLLNSLADIANACNVVLAQHGLPAHPVEAYRKMVGNGFDMLIRRALPADINFDESDFIRFTALAREYYGTHMMEQTTPYPGMPQALRKLVEAGIQVGVLSNKPDAQSRPLIKNFFPDIPFIFVQGAIPGVPLKPDPCSLLRLMEEHGLPCAETAYTGDSNVDMVTARNASVKGWGAGWGFRGAQELKDAGADMILDEPGDLFAAAGI